MAKLEDDMLGIQGRIGRMTAYTRNGKKYLRVAHTHQPRRLSRKQLMVRERQSHNNALWRALKETNQVYIEGGDNALYYPTTGAGIGAQRAYFKIGDDGALLARPLTAFNIDFGDDEATGIISTTNYTNDTNSDAWFTLDGRRLSAKPSVKGVYVNNGRKVIIK